MSTLRGVGLAGLLTLGLAARAQAQATPAPALAHGPSPAGAQHDNEAREQAVRSALVGWGCVPQDVLRFGERWLAACGAAGVFVVAEGAGETLAWVERRTTPGLVTGLFARDGAVWVETVHRDARPLSDFSALAPLDGSAAAPAQGATNPLPPATQAQPWAGANDAPMPTGTGAPPPAESIMAPSRVGDVLIAEAGLRPFLPLRSQKFALLAEFSVSYRGARPWYVHARILPLGVGVGGDRNVVLFGGSLVAGYDQQYFAVGVGLGAARRGLVVQQATGVDSEHFEQDMRFAVTQAARLGALDGLHLSAQSSFLLLPDHWALASFELKGQIPINRETWLAPAGGGGRQTGFFYVEVGLRRLLRGDRGHGSLFLRPSVGIAAVDARTADSAWHPGPMVGVHLEWRQ